MIKYNKKITLLSYIIQLLIISIYFIYITINSCAFNDGWVLNELLIFFIVVSGLGVILFYNKYVNILFNIIYVTIINLIIIIFTPIIKYPNTIHLYGVWDSLAHYSFTDWILVHGRVPEYGLLYAESYGAHPGNGILPSSLVLIGGFSLGPSMSITLIFSYLVYFLILLNLIVKYDLINLCRNSVKKFLEILLYLSIIYISPYYVGTTISYAYISIILFLALDFIKNRIHYKKVFIFVFIYIALLITHLSSSFIITLFLLCFLIIFVIMKFYNNIKINSLLHISILLIFIFLTYNIILDPYFNKLIISGKYIFESLYVYEDKLLETRMSDYGLSLLDLIVMVFSFYGKQFMVLLLAIISLIFLMVLKLKRKTILKIKKIEHINIIILLIITSSSLWFLGYLGTGELLQGARSVPVIQFILIYSIIYIRNIINSNLKFKPNINKLIIIFIIFIIIFNTVYNYGLQPASPILMIDGYKIKSSINHGPVSEFVFEAVTFMNRHSTDVVLFSFQHCFTFGYADLMWNLKNKLITGINLTKTDDILDNINSIFNKNKNFLMPMPSYDNVLPGKLGYVSFYRDPLIYLISKTNVCYSNKYYMIFYL